MKKVLVGISILAVFIGVYFSYQNASGNLKKLVTISIGEGIPKAHAYLESAKDIDIIWKNLEQEDGKVYHAGTYEGSFSYKGKEYTVTLKVKDTVPPTITGVKNITITLDDSIDLWADITVSDDSKDELKKEIQGEYDITKVGEYPLSYVVTDLGENKKEESFLLTVTEKKEEHKTTEKGYLIEEKDGLTYIDGVLIVNKTYRLPSTYDPKELQIEFMNHFNEMKQDAAKVGIYLTIISGYRDYKTQEIIYKGYVEKDGEKGADRYSARPGHSEHQTGLAADLNSLSISFANTEEGRFLNENCARYGFIIRYPKGKESITGYMYEPWHIRYVGTELANKLYQDGTWTTLEEYFGISSSYEKE